MFRLLSEVVTRRGWAVLLAWVLIGFALVKWAPLWSAVSQDDNVRFFPAGYPSVVGSELTERGFPSQAASSSFVLVLERAGGSLTPTDLAYVDRVADLFKRLQTMRPDLGIRSVTDRRTPIMGARLVGSAPEGGSAALVTVSLTTTYAAKQTRITVDAFEEELAAMPPAPEGLQIAFTGSAAVGHDQNSAANESIARTTRATILLVVMILLIVYRSPLLALIPLTTIGLSVFIGLKAIACMALVPFIDFQVINVTNVFVVVVLFGAGTDYCLFLIARYREELSRGRGRVEALREAIQRVGGALVASAGTVIVGLGMLYFSSFAKIQFTGPAIAISLIIALTATLTLAPVLLYWLRGAVFWPFKPPHHVVGNTAEEDSLDSALASRFWTGVSNFVVRRPALILLASLLFLVPLAYVGYHTEASYSLLADLDASKPSVVGAHTIKRYFPVGELSPTWVVIENKTVDFRSGEGAELIETLCGRLEKIPNVAEVRAVSRPLGEPLAVEPATQPAPASTGTGFLSGLVNRAQQSSKQIQQAALRAGADPRYVSTRPADPKDRNRITRIEVVFDSDPFEPQSRDTLTQVREVIAQAVSPGGPLAGPTRVGFAGTTAEVNDLRMVTLLDQRRMYYLVTIGVYIVLLLLLRRPLVCLYLIATVLLGYLASLGITELVFQGLHAGPGPWNGLDWKVGFFLFVILVAVGEDYNILLMARVVEEERKHGPIEGTRLAVAHTGGIISSCGLIMAGTFGSMLTGSLLSLRELGFALGLGVLLDTFIVRPILVPAFIVLWHRTFPGRAIESSIAASSVSLDDTASART